MKATGSFASQTLVEIEGKIANTGDRAVEVVEIYCVFRDPYGQLIYKPRAAYRQREDGRPKPGETKSFRLPFDEIPDSWNQALPQLVVAGVKFSLVRPNGVALLGFLSGNADAFQVVGQPHQLLVDRFFVAVLGGPLQRRADLGQIGKAVRTSGAFHVVAA